MITMIMIMIINVEPAHRHHAVPGRIGGSQLPLGVFLLRVLDDREPNLRSGAWDLQRDPDSDLSKQLWIFPSLGASSPRYIHI